ncbi:MAG: acyl-CoA dehydrogenase family protein [bacterium]
MSSDDAPAVLAADLYGYEGMLTPDEWRIVRRTRDFLERRMAPIAMQCWEEARFPHELTPEIAELEIMGLSYARDDVPAASRLLTGFLGLELSRVDPSMATFYGVHNGLAMGTIHHCGSAEQKERWLPGMRRLELIGAFGLTEPEGGSDVAGGLRTTARRDGDEWVLDGAKRWIGNATFADLTVIWARDVADDQVKGFVVEKATPGFTATKIEHKLALRTVQNADISLVDCRVPEANRLVGATSFRDTAAVLRATRGGVAWSAVGCQIGAYELAVAYAAEREQFGRPIGHFQLVQDLLARMLGNITASLGMTVRVAQLQQDGVFRDEQAALAKSYCTSRLRETVAWARELLGGNGILLDHGVARFFADAEALYSYEGTREINALIVGRAITGTGAFV